MNNNIMVDDSVPIFCLLTERLQLGMLVVRIREFRIVSEEEEGFQACWREGCKRETKGSGKVRIR